MNLVWRRQRFWDATRNQGIDVLCLEPKIILKAPVGGFRTKPKLAWENDEIQPKPSPTVMFFNNA
jgi:hypothetical protein